MTCAREGFTVHGVEGARTVVVQARRRLDSECLGWKGSIDEGDFVHLPYPECHFDAVMDIEAVCHNDFPSSCRAYREVARVLKPGGKLFVRTFDTSTTRDRTGEPLGRNAWRVSKGPMLGKGLSRFTDEGDFSELFGPDWPSKHATFSLRRWPIERR